jgi:hypothetical protein
MPIDLFGEPLKPLPIFFGTCAFTFVCDVAAQIAPSDAHCAAQQSSTTFNGTTRANTAYPSNSRMLAVDWTA